MNSSIVLIANPAAGRFSRPLLEKLEAEARRRGYDLKLRLTGSPGQGTALARQALKEKPDMVLAAGGDGTVNEVINGLAGGGVPLGIIPLGTVNVLARELALPLRPVEALGHILDIEEPREITLGKVTHSEGSRYFVLMAGAGFDAETVGAVQKGLKRWIGRAAYVVSGLKLFLTWRGAGLEFTIDGEESAAGTMLVAANAAHYAGDNRIAPGARLEDPRLRFVLLTGGRRLDLLRYSWHVLRGTHQELPDVRMIDATTCEIKSAAWLQTDGELCCRTPAVIEAVPKALRIHG